MEKSEVIDIGIGRYAVVNGGVLACRGLGSCVAIAICRKDRSLGGMAHAMLPQMVNKNIDILKPPEEDARYVDKAIDLLLEKLGKRCEAKLVGGATLFSSDDVGKRNVEAARKKLSEGGIRIVSEDIGGTRARSCFFYADSGKVVVRSSVRIGFDVRFLEKEI